MVTVSLPEQPDLRELRDRARDLQHGVRSGEPTALEQAALHEADPDYPLAAARLRIARGHGFVTWQRLCRHVEAISALSWTPTRDIPAVDRPAEKFLRLACLTCDGHNENRDAEAVEVLAHHPELLTTHVAVAIACADVAATRQHLASTPSAAQDAAPPFGWAPLMYATHSRIDVKADASLATVRLLLQAGADPNDGRFFGGLPTPFSVLTGALGGGESGQAPHPHAMQLARLLLEAGADPNDGQAVYNRMFTTDDDFLMLLLEFGLGHGDGGVWRRLLPDLLPDPASLVRTLLHWAVTHDQGERVALLARHGVDVISPFDDGATPIQIALRNGHRRLAEQLRRLGAPAPRLNSVEEFIAAALAGDATAVRATPATIVADARAARPALVVWATGQQRIAAVSLLVEAGFDVNAFGRGDEPVEEKWQTALHTAVGLGSIHLVQRLLELGAERNLRDKRYGATASEWAAHFGYHRIRELLVDGFES